MKKNVVFLFGLLCLLKSSISYSQSQCGSEINLSAMQANEPDRYQRYMDLKNFTLDYVASQGQNNTNSRLINPNGLIIIPVVVHVLHNGEAIGGGFNISQAQIQSQIDVLNEDFRRLNPDRINTPSRFSGRAADNTEVKIIFDKKRLSK